jgi:hypothetical protein
MNSRRALGIVTIAGTVVVAAGLLGACAGSGSSSVSVGVGYGIYGGPGWNDPFYGRPGGWYPIGPPVRPPPVRPPTNVRPPPSQLPSNPRPMPR